MELKVEQEEFIYEPVIEIKMEEELIIHPLHTDIKVEPSSEVCTQPSGEHQHTERSDNLEERQPFNNSQEKFKLKNTECINDGHAIQIKMEEELVIQPLHTDIKVEPSSEVCTQPSGEHQHTERSDNLEERQPFNNSKKKRKLKNTECVIDEHAIQIKMEEEFVIEGVQLEYINYQENKLKSTILIENSLSPQPSGDHQQTEGTPHVKQSYASTDTLADNASHLKPQTRQDKSNLEHIAVHTGDKPFQCLICSKRFLRKSHVTEHIRVHTGEVPYQCLICSKRFSRKSHMTQHIRVHTGDKPFQCAICSRRFPRKPNLVHHIRAHTGDKPYQCEICTKRFSYKGVMLRHIADHTGHKPYHCGVCSKRFMRKVHMLQHIDAVHTGEKPYQCEICSKRFTQKVNMVRHIVVHTGDKTFQCSVCSKRFTRKSDMLRHIKVHTGDKPHQCEICSKRFLRKDWIVQHMRVHIEDKNLPLRDL